MGSAELQERAFKIQVNRTLPYSTAFSLAEPKEKLESGWTRYIAFGLETEPTDILVDSDVEPNQAIIVLGLVKRSDREFVYQAVRVSDLELIRNLIEADIPQL